MSRLALVAIMAVGAAVAVPATRTSHADGGSGDQRAGSVLRDEHDKRDERVGVTVSKVECPASIANVVLTAPRDRGTAEYSVHRGDGIVRNGLLWPGVERTIPVYIEPRTTERIEVTLDGQGTTRYQVSSRCDSGEESYGDYRESVYQESEGESESRSPGLRPHGRNPLIRRHLPYTGPPPDLYGKVATATGLVVFGGMLWWIGMIWPRRTPAGPLSIRRSPYGARRHPGPPPS